VGGGGAPFTQKPFIASITFEPSLSLLKLWWRLHACACTSLYIAGHIDARCANAAGTARTVDLIERAD